jgi:aspartyl protease family protein
MVVSGCSGSAAPDPTGCDGIATEQSAPDSEAAQAEAIEDDLPVRGSASLNRKSDGHYWGTADIDGVAVSFLVDTGATKVALTRRDAERVGIDPESLTFDIPINTAGGEVRGAIVTLPSIRFGNVEIEGVEALVLEDRLEQSLLGMSFLGELYSYEFRRKQLIIRR